MGDLTTKQQEYALRAMRSLATAGKGVMVKRKDMAEAEKIPPHFLAKILQDFGKAGIIEVRQGSKGGPVLLKDPSEVNILKVLEICSGPMRFGRETGGKISLIMQNCESMLFLYLEDVTIADLVEDDE